MHHPTAGTTFAAKSLNFGISCLCPILAALWWLHLLACTVLTCTVASLHCLAWLADISWLQFVLRHCNFLALMRPGNAYTELLNDTDSAMMPWLRKFQVRPQGIVKFFRALVPGESYG